jgi:sensor histidine kinase YesM
VDDVLVDTISGIGQTTLALQPYHQRLSIRFALIAPEAVDSILYRYRIGHQNSWIDAGTNRMFHFEGWNRNNFNFEVQAIHLHSGLLLGKAFLAINARTYFWKKWWFLAVSTILISAVIAFLIRLRIRMIKSRYQLKATYERQLAQTEMAALRSQLNPHFLFNSLNSIKHYIISNEPRIATRYLNKFASLVRLALDNSKHSTIPLSSEIEFLTLFLDLEQMRLGEKLHFKFYLDPVLEPDRILIPPMLIQPFIENAIWHGIHPKSTPGLVTIRISRLAPHLKVVIEDDGIGRAAGKHEPGAHQTRKSMGLKLIRDRLELLEKTDLVSSGFQIEDLRGPDDRPAGTRITLYIPLQDEQNETS